MHSFLPEDLYPDSEACPAGKVLTVCWNPSDYSLGHGYGSSGKLKLESQSNFGSSGPSKYGFRTYEIQASQITVQGLLNLGCDIFQSGLSTADAGGWGRSALTDAQFAEVVAWADMSVTHVVLGAQVWASKFGGGYGPAATGAVNPMVATDLGASFIRDGPFGDASTFSQGGSWQGTLTSLSPDACVLIRDSSGSQKPIMVIDRKYNSVFLSDVDILTDLGGMTSGSAVSSVNDRLFGNLYSFLTGIVCNGPPADCEFNVDPFEICNAA